MSTNPKTVPAQALDSHWRRLKLTLLGALASGLLLYAPDLQAQDADFEYVGSRRCRVCHRSEKKGDQYGVWSGSSHASSLDALMTDEALKTAQEKGLTVPPFRAPECLQCHVTGWGKPGGYQILSEEFTADEANAKAVKKNNALASVSCETCHGPGSAYKSKKTMQKIFEGTITRESVGLLRATEETCLGCHNERSPQFKGFDFEERLARIAHAYPQDFRP